MFLRWLIRLIASNAFTWSLFMWIAWLILDDEGRLKLKKGIEDIMRNHP